MSHPPRRAHAAPHRAGPHRLVLAFALGVLCTAIFSHGLDGASSGEPDRDAALAFADETNAGPDSDAEVTDALTGDLSRDQSVEALTDIESDAAGSIAQVASTDPRFELDLGRAQPRIDLPTDRPLRILAAGDSLTRQFGLALDAWAQRHPGRLVVHNEAENGCVIARFGEKRNPSGGVAPVGDYCDAWADPVAGDRYLEPGVISWPTAVERFDPDAVIIDITAWDVTDRRVPSLGDQWTWVGNPDFDAYLRSEYALAVDTLSAGGAPVYFLLAAELNVPLVPQNNPVRLARLNDLVIDLFRDDPRVGFLDYPTWLGPVGLDRELQLRRDGVHLDENAFTPAAQWVLERLGVISST